jgi:hypothetical protein
MIYYRYAMPEQKLSDQQTPDIQQNATQPKERASEEIALTHGTVKQVVDKLGAEGVTTEAETLQELLTAFLEGQDWALQRFGWDRRPTTATYPFEEERRLATARYLLGQNRIEINTHRLEEERGFSPQEEFTIFYHPLPDKLRPHMTSRQYYQGVGVKETINYLQDNHVGGLLPTPAIGRKPYDDLVEAYSKPYELEALQYVGTFFQEQHRSNPYAHMETQLRAHASERK